MTVNEKGVLKESERYFYTCTKKATLMYLYPLSIGSFHCNSDYVINRQSYNSFMLIYVKSGKGYVTQNNLTHSVKAGDLVFLDCYEPHSYYTDTQWDILWLHFDGIVARHYFEEVTSENFVFSFGTHNICVQRLEKIYNFFNKSNNIIEPLMSKYITDILTELVMYNALDGENVAYYGIMETLLTYISEHAEEKLTIENLAKRVNLSTYHFIRIFSRETGFTPYDYIMRVRIQRTKFYLKSTKYTIQEIAYRTGFQRESSLCAAFKKSEGITPGAYRRLKDE